MFVENIEGGLGLVDSDELLGSLSGSVTVCSALDRGGFRLTLSTFSGRVCNGGGILTVAERYDQVDDISQNP